jgi:hypothetical protein
VNFGIQFSNFGYIVWLDNQILFGETDDLCCCGEGPPECWCGGCIAGTQPDTVTVSLTGITETDNECYECLDLDGTYVLTKCNNTDPTCPRGLTEGCWGGRDWNPVHRFGDWEYTQVCQWTYAGQIILCDDIPCDFLIRLAFDGRYQFSEMYLALEVWVGPADSAPEWPCDLMVKYAHVTNALNCASLSSVTLDHWWKTWPSPPNLCAIGDEENASFVILG